MEKLDLKSLTLRQAMLAHGCQTLDMLYIKFLKYTSSSLEFVLPDHMKKEDLLIVRRQSLCNYILTTSPSLFIHN